MKEEEGLDASSHITIYKKANFRQNLRCDVNLAARDQTEKQSPLFHKEIMTIKEMTQTSQKPCAIYSSRMLKNLTSPIFK